MQIRTIVGALAVCGLMSQANATSLSLNPNSAQGSPGDILEFDIFYDFNAEPTLGGGFDVSFDDSALTFLNYSAAGAGDPSFSRAPDIVAGLLSGFAFGHFNGISGTGLVGTLMFEINAVAAPGLTSLMVADTSSIAGPFVSATTFLAMDMDYFGADVDILSNVVVPEPGIPSLFGMGLLVLWAGRRHQRLHSDNKRTVK